MTSKGAETQERQIHLFVSHALLDLEQVTTDINAKEKEIKHALLSLTGTNQGRRRRLSLSRKNDLQRDLDRDLFLLGGESDGLLLFLLGGDLLGDLFLLGGDLDLFLS